jgi:hypothetical protein
MSDMQKKDDNPSQLPHPSSTTPALLSGSGSNSQGTSVIPAAESKDHTCKGEKQEKSGTMYLNEFRQRKGEDNKVEYQPYKCKGFTEHKPLYGCRAIVNGILMGQSDQAAAALGLVEKKT